MPWTLRAAILAALLTAALGGAGSAGAVLPAPCTGDHIEGFGSSLQDTAQRVWTTGFNDNMVGGCTVNPKVTFQSTNSGDCLHRWGFIHSATPVIDTTVAFCATTAPPLHTQITAANAATRSNVLTIPVAQTAIAIIANPPEGCTVDFVTAAEVERVFRGVVTTWGSLDNATNHIPGACTTSITPVVRADDAGTTYQFKHYLFTINNAAVLGASTWRDLQPLTDKNTTWPGTPVQSQSGCVMTFPCPGGVGSGIGDFDEVKTVGVLPHSIGYASLPVARDIYTTTTYSTLIWLKLKGPGVLSPVTDPSTNGLSETRANANCTANAGSYTNGAGVLPGSATASWSDVYLTSPGTLYPLCTLTWDLALTHYAPHWGVTGPAIARTVRDYLHYILTGGQTDILNKDYQVLSADVREVATTGVQEITG